MIKQKEACNACTPIRRRKGRRTRDSKKVRYLLITWRRSLNKTKFTRTNRKSWLLQKFLLMSQLPYQEMQFLQFTWLLVILFIFFFFCLYQKFSVQIFVLNIPLKLIPKFLKINIITIFGTAPMLFIFILKLNFFLNSSFGHVLCI